MVLQIMRSRQLGAQHSQCSGFSVSLRSVYQGKKKSIHTSRLVLHQNELGRTTSASVPAYSPAQRTHMNGYLQTLLSLFQWTIL